MSIQKPYAISIKGKVIDANEDNLVSWQVSGGIQYYKGMEIRLNSNDNLVYKLNKTASFTKSHIIPSETLANGVEYKIRITVWDEEDNSQTSEYVVFETSSRPIVGVDAIETIGAPSYLFTFTYLQSQSVPLRSWIAYIYDSVQNLLDDSGIQTSTPLEYLFEGFESGENYYVRFQATSNKGLVGDSGLVPFSVLYLHPNFNSVITTENVENAGVKISLKAQQILGEAENYSFISNEKLDIRNGGRVVYKSGFRIEDDFSIRILVEEVPNENFLIVENAPIIVSATKPTDPSAIWIKDENQVGTRTLTLVASPTEPIVDDIAWIKDTSLVTERILTINVDIHKPSGENVAWIDLGSNFDNLTINIIRETTYTIYLRRYNNIFYLYKDDEIVDELELTATNYCLVIKRIGGVWSLEGGDVTP